ncbi:MAG: phosphoglycerate mutase family protein [Gemmatimonadota bacterium]
MTLTLVRHAIAIDGADDDRRPLSDKGRRRFARVVRALARLEMSFDVVAHSPKLRALQTAEALVPRLRAGGSTTVLDQLADAPKTGLIKTLEAWEGDVAVVGHEPHLSALLAWLVTGSRGDGASFDLKKGGVAVLEGPVAPGAMTLTLLLTPRLARRLR